MSSFGRGPPEDQSYHVWLNLPSSFGGDVFWSFFYFLALAAILCSGATGAEWFGQFWLRSSQGTILSCLTEICPVVTEQMLFEVLSIFSYGGHFVQWSKTVWAILVEDLPRYNPTCIKFGWNLPSGSGGDVWSFFLFLALVAILCSRVYWFEQFC